MSGYVKQTYIIDSNESYPVFNSKNLKINYKNVKKSYGYNIYQRTLDLVLSTIGLIIAIPLMIIFGILIKIEDRGSITYKQSRLGKDGKEFYIYKLRSMKIDAEKYGAQWAEKEDPRITKIGNFIRKTRIDELPQLFNILKGEMSIVGPRPERPEFTYEFNEEIPGFIDRLAVRPGLTGWAQVNGGYDITPAEKLKLDIYYIKNRSIIMDINIIIKTVGVIFTGSGAR